MAKPEKATLSKMEKYKKQLSEDKAPAKAEPKKAHKKPVKGVASPIHKEETAALPVQDEPKEKEGHPPRGERGDFLKTTITISAEMLTDLRALGMRRRSAKQKDTDTSALIREALTDFLKKHKT